MKKMLIVGNEYPGVKSVAWEDVLSVNIADYQVVLIDLTTYSGMSGPERTHVARNIYLLFQNSSPVIIFMPRKGIDRPYEEVIPFGINSREKIGMTVKFSTDDAIIDFYHTFVTKHEVVLVGYPPAITIEGSSTRVVGVIWNNINEICGLKYDSLYFLHPPDVRLHKKALESFVDYFSPDMEEEDKEDKPEWLEPYELSGLGLRTIEDAINEIEGKIQEYVTKKDEKIVEKDMIAKWGDLITKQGRTLEVRLKEAFEYLGVEVVKHEPVGVHGHDLEIIHKGICFIVEVEGTKGGIKIDKARNFCTGLRMPRRSVKGCLSVTPFAC